MNTITTTLAASTIFVLHLSIILFIVITPFYPRVSWLIRILHFVVGCSLLLHWCLNDATCVLTILESRLRGINESESFMHRLVSPVYMVSDEKLRLLSIYSLPILMVVNLWQLYLDPEIKGLTLRDIFTSPLGLIR